ncbi:MAG: hypothetical protein PHX51_08585 [Clostridia bacterium]|nr:hypothetical protein [Clostridia bacterium]
MSDSTVKVYTYRNYSICYNFRGHFFFSDEIPDINTHNAGKLEEIIDEVIQNSVKRIEIYDLYGNKGEITSLSKDFFWYSFEKGSRGRGKENLKCLAEEQSSDCIYFGAIYIPINEETTKLVAQMEIIDEQSRIIGEARDNIRREMAKHRFKDINEMLKYGAEKNEVRQEKKGKRKRKDEDKTGVEIE